MAQGDQVVECSISDVQQNMSTGWFTVLTDQGKFKTKIAELAQEAASLKGLPRVRLWFKPDTRPQNINPHTGSPYAPDNYYQRAEEIMGNGGGSFTAPAAGITVVGQPAEPATPTFTPQPERGEDPRRAWRICLQSGAKCAIATLPLMPPEQQNFDVQKQIAIAWAKFFFFTPPPQSTEGTVTPPTFAGIDPADSGDDIPF